MRITMLKATNMELTEAIRAHVEDRVESLKKLCGDAEPSNEIQIEVGKSTKHHAKGPYFQAEMQLAVPGASLRVVEQAEDLYVAIDQARDHLKRQLKDHKDKLVDRRRGQRPDKE